MPSGRTKIWKKVILGSIKISKIALGKRPESVRHSVNKEKY
jgi:hypothetical protein